MIILPYMGELGMGKLKSAIGFQKNWKQVVLFLLIHVAVICIAFCFYSNDYYKREINLNEFTIQSEPGGNVNPAVDSEQYFSLKLSGQDAAVLETNKMTIPIGYYMVYVQYETERDCSLESYSSTYLNRDNSLGNTFGGMTLSKDHTTAEGPIWVDQDARDFVFLFHYNGGNTTIYNITLKSMKPYPDAWWYCGIALLFEIILALFYYNGRKKGSMRSFYMFIYVLMLALLASIPLMNDFVYDNGDLAFHIDRIEGISYYLTHFTWSQPFMRINEVSGNGGGYAAPVFYPQVFLFIPGALHIFGCSMLMAYKVYIFVVNFMTAWISFVSFRGLSRRWDVGAIGCAAYTMAIYRLTDIYYRAAVGEYTAMAFLPLFFWTLYEVIYREHKKWPYLAISMMGILGSHILTTAVCGCFAVILVFINVRKLLGKLVRIGALLKALAVTALLNAWFLIPFVRSSTMPLSIFTDPDKQSDVSGSVVYFSQMFNTHVFDMGVSQNVGNTNGEMPLSIGMLLLGSAILYFVISYIARKYKSNLMDERVSDHLFFTGAAISIWMASYLFPWKQVQMLMPGVSKIQFSWRMLAFATVFLSYLFGRFGGLIYDFIRKELPNKKWEKPVLVILLMALTSLPFTEIHPYFDSLQDAPSVCREDVELMGEPDALYLYSKTNNDIKNLEISDLLKASVFSVQRSGTHVCFQTDVEHSASDLWIKLPVNYFQGYHLCSDGYEIPIQKSDDGKIMFQPATGKRQYELYFREWKSWLFGDAISICSAVILAFRKIRGVQRGK